MGKYGLHGKLKAQPGKGEALSNILLEASNLVAQSKGCQVYLISTDNSQAETVWVTEVWDSKEDHDNSLKNEEVRALIGKAMPILDGMPEKGQELEVLGGLGLKE